MDKLFVFFVIALFTNGAFGQGQTQQNEEDLEDRYGWNRPNWNPFPGQRPTFPGQRPTFPGQRPTFPTASPNTAPTTVPTTGTTTLSPAVRQCMSSCPVTAEYNPVCGTDSITYTNPGRLTCAQLCGVSVTLLRTSPCPTPAPVDPA